MELGTVYSLKDMRREQNASFSPLSVGWYVASIQGVELKVGKAGDNRYLRIKYIVELPGGANKTLYSNITLMHSNAKAEEIGRKQQILLQQSAGIEMLQNTDQLIGVRMKVYVDQRTTEQYGTQNNVVSFEKIREGEEVSDLPF